MWSENSADVAARAQLRRTFLRRGLGALGALALDSLLAERAGRALAEPTAGPPGAGAKAPAQRPRVRSVVLLFQHGGPSQMDLFDPKPELTRRQGQPYPGQVEAHFHKQQGNLLASPFRFLRHGHSGIELCELLPRLGSVADDITLVRSMATESVDHEAALRLVHTGKLQAGRPSWASWALYGLGSVNENLPAYVVLPDPGGMPIDTWRNWTSGWLPAAFQGTPVRSGPSAVLNLRSPEGVSPQRQREQLELLGALNREHLARHPGQSELLARVADFEMAARMQTAVPEVLEFGDETAATRAAYGLDREETAEYGGRCLLARRLVERGVRFVQLYLHGQPWDTHNKNAEQLRSLCARSDQPSAALVADLKQRGLLDETLVIWTGEFGRLPISQGTDGRDHNRHAFSLWLAGGPFRRGYVHGATDEFGYRSVQDVVNVHDFHATLLAALGLDHLRLTYPNDGRDDSLTDTVVSGAKVVPGLFA